MKSVILLCAGLGTRFGADKMQIDLKGKHPIDHLLEIFSFADETILVVPSGKVKEYRSRYAQCKVVAGGNTRFDSAKAGLGALSPQCRLVALHDGARPFVSRALAERCFAEAAAYGCCIPVQQPFYYACPCFCRRISCPMNTREIYSPMSRDAICGVYRWESSPSDKLVEIIVGLFSKIRPLTMP